jgi:hypothetical protein
MVVVFHSNMRIAMPRSEWCSSSADLCCHSPRKVKAARGGQRMVGSGAAKLALEDYVHDEGQRDRRLRRLSPERSSVGGRAESHSHSRNTIDDHAVHAASDADALSVGKTDLRNVALMRRDSYIDEATHPDRQEEDCEPKDPGDDDTLNKI